MPSKPQPTADPPRQRRTRRRSSAQAPQPIELTPEQILPESKVCDEATHRLISCVHEYSKAIHVLYLYIAHLEDQLDLPFHKDWEGAIGGGSEDAEAKQKVAKDVYSTMLTLSRGLPGTSKYASRDARPWRPNGFYQEAEHWEKLMQG
jgi:hypothetical protein